MELMSTIRCSPEPSRECSSIFFTMESARLPCCTILSRLPRRVFVSSVISASVLASTFTLPTVSFSSSVNSTDTPEKLLTKLSGFYFVSGTGSELPQRGELLCLNKAILGRPQILLRFCERAGTLLFGLEQSGVFNCDCRLICERGDQFDLLV